MKHTKILLLFFLNVVSCTLNTQVKKQHAKSSIFSYANMGRLVVVGGLIQASIRAHDIYRQQWSFNMEAEEVAKRFGQWIVFVGGPLIYGIFVYKIAKDLDSWTNKNICECENDESCYEPFD